MTSRNFISDCRQSKGWVIYKAFRVIANSKEDELNKKYISNRIKYPQHDLKQDEAIRQLNLGVEDKILDLNDQNYFYGKTSFKQNDHDWYCFKCHETGNVFKCSNCWRVFHVKCANFIGEKCKQCELLTIPQHAVRGEVLAKEKIKKILKIILNKLNEDAKHVNTLSVIEGSYYNSVPIKEIKKLVYNSEKNFNTLENKISNNLYNTLLEFQVDCEDINHNLLVLYGPKGRISKLVEKMFELCTKEIEFANECLNCFNLFYDKNPEKKTFYSLCSPPHKIVFAKFKGFPLWPCKIIVELEKTYQVWFFGGNFVRSHIDKKCIYTVEEAIKILSTEVQPNKGSKMYQKAISEYDNYMERNNNLSNQIGNLILNKTINGESSSMHFDEIDAVSPPTNFLLAMGEVLNGSVLTTTNQLPTSITNGNSKSLDGASNLSFTFNGDSMNNSISNSDLDFQATTPIKSEKNDKTQHVIITQPFSGLSTPASSEKPLKNGKKNSKQSIQDSDAKEENKLLKRKLKETEDKLIELRQLMKECYTKEYVDNLNLEYKNMLVEVKKKTWCRVCEREAFYYCCWNTFYCSLECQTKHWWSDHKNQCFRKKHKKSVSVV